MSKKIIKMISLLTVMTLAFVGCGTVSRVEDTLSTSREESTENTTKTAEIEKGFPSYYQNTDGRVIFDCEVIAPDDIKVYKTTAKKKEFSDDILEKFKGEYLQGIEFIKEYEEADYYHASWETGNIGLTNISFLYMTTDFIGLGQSLRLFEYQGNISNGKKFLTGDELSFASIEDTNKKLEQNLNYVGVAFADVDYHLYTCEHSTLTQEFVPDETPEGKEKTEDIIYPMEGYYYSARQKLQGLPVFTKTADIMFFEDDENVQITAFFTENGLAYFSARDLYSFQETDERIDLLPFEQITENLSDYFNKLLSQKEYRVIRAKLYNYVLKAEKDYQVTPVWIFQIEEDDDLTETGKYVWQMEMNAVNGEVFVRD